MNVSAASNNALLFAIADLAMTRSLLAAISTTAPGVGLTSGRGVEPRTNFTPTPEIEPRFRVQPETEIKPRFTVQPEDRVLPLSEPTDEPVELKPVDTLDLLLPAPWQLVLRDHVWNKPVEAEPVDAQPPKVYEVKTGKMLDTFL
ncbi:MAG: hypothetical protein AAGK78_07300 [Planctomycetota bacterium]